MTSNISYPWPSQVHPADKALLAKLYATWLTYPSPDPRKLNKSVAGENIRKGMAQGRQWAVERPEPWNALQQAWNTNPSQVWIWSDLHLFHDNIIQRAQRPFHSLIEMNEKLLESAIALSKEDWLIFVGDVSFGNLEDTQLWLSMIQAHKMLVLGNHDIHNVTVRKNPFEVGFEGVCEAFEIQKDGQKLWLTHYPIFDGWLSKDTLNVHGHLHNHVLEGPYVNVCVEQTSYQPVLLQDVIQSRNP